MLDLSPYQADLELSPTVMASLSETVLTSLLSQTAIPLRDSSHILALRQRASPLPPSILQSVAPSPTEPHSAAVCATSESFLYSTSLLGSSSKENHSPDSASVKSDEGNVSFVSDSTALGNTDVELMHDNIKYGCLNQLRLWMLILFIQIRQWSHRLLPFHRYHITPIHIHQELGYP